MSEGVAEDLLQAMADAVDVEQGPSNNPFKLSDEPMFVAGHLATSVTEDYLEISEAKLKRHPVVYLKFSDVDPLLHEEGI